MHLDWKDSIIRGMLAGIIWGWMAMAVNALSGAFVFEHSLMHNLTVFAIGGAILALVITGFLKLTYDWIPFKNIFAKAIFLSATFWILLFIGGKLLSSIEPERYHFVTTQSVQGLVLSIILGGFIGLLWKVKAKEV